MATRWSSHPGCSRRYRSLHVSSSANDSFKKFMGARSCRAHHSHFSHGRKNRRSSFCRCRTVREEVRILKRKRKVEGTGRGRERKRKEERGKERGKGNWKSSFGRNGKKSQTPQPGIEPGTPANAADENLVAIARFVNLCLPICTTAFMLWLGPCGSQTLHAHTQTSPLDGQCDGVVVDAEFALRRCHLSSTERIFFSCTFR